MLSQQIISNKGPGNHLITVLATYTQYVPHMGKREGGREKEEGGKEGATLVKGLVQQLFDHCDLTGQGSHSTSKEVKT